MASSILDLILNTRKTGTGAKDAKKELDGVTTSLKSLAAGAGMALGAGGAAFMLGKFLQDSVAQAAEAQKAHAQLTNTLANMGGSAGISAKGVESLALSLSRMSAVDDEAIVGIETMALRAGILAGQLPKFTETVLDLAAATGQSLPEAATLMVAAYDEPVAAINRLERSGLRLPAALETQIAAMVKAGDTAGATAALIKHLADVTGGSAAAAAHTYAGEVQNLTNEWGNFKENAGTSVLPALSAILSALNSSLVATNDLNSAIEATGAVMTFAATQSGFHEQMYKLRDGTLLTAEGLIRLVDVTERATAAAGGFNAALAEGKDKLGELGAAGEEAAPKFLSLAEAMKASPGALIPIDFSLPDPSTEFAKIQEYVNKIASGEATGSKIMADIEIAMQTGQIGPQRGEDIARQVGITTADLQFKAGDIDAEELQTQLTEVYGMPAEMAKTHIQEVMDTTTDELQSKIAGLGTNLAKEIQKVNPAVKAAMQPVFDAASAWAGIKSKEITIKVNWEGGFGPGGQHGLDMIVPPEHPNDSYAVFASSHERVIVQTPAQQAAGVTVGGPAPGGGAAIGQVGPIYVNNGTDERALLAMLRRMSG